MRNIILGFFVILGIFTAGCVYETPYSPTYTPYIPDSDANVIYT